MEKAKKVLGIPVKKINDAVLRAEEEHDKKTNAKQNIPLVFLVEDDKFLRNIIGQKLTQAGFRVEEACDGKEALKKLETLTPKIILLDLLLPEIDGFTVLKQMKENKELSKIPVLVLSNLGQDEDMQRAKTLGAKDYMVKAYFTPSEIVDRVQKILRETYF